MRHAHPSFSILWGLRGGNPTIHIPLPHRWHPKPSRVITSRSILHSGSNLRLLPDLPLIAELLLKAVQADLASLVSTGRTHLATVVSCRLLCRSELLLPTKEHGADCIKISLYPSLGFLTWLEVPWGSPTLLQNENPDELSINTVKLCAHLHT